MSSLSRPLPEALAPLSELALDLYWSWNHEGDQLWQRINPEVWNRTLNPVEVMQLTGDEQFSALAHDEQFLQRLNQLVEARELYLSEPTWYQKGYADSALKGVVYMSMEFGLCDALSLYAGGLGILAGDYLKTASDLGVPVVGIGLLYQQGYFHQSLDAKGWQQETYLYNDPGSLPMRPAMAPDGSWLHIDTRFLCRRVRFRVWQVTVGRVSLFLLDSNDPRNQAGDRGITAQLYGGNHETRLVQEIALGICGWRLAEELGLGDWICHLNEGHAAFATLERARNYRERFGGSFDEALWATRGGNVFTTHTPVAAGFDRYPPDLLRRYIDEFAQHIQVPMERLLDMGRLDNHGRDEWFNMAYLAMRTCARINGVSQLHGAVSRKIFQPLFPRWPEREVPVGHVTNGVHVPTWDSPRADNEWRRLFGPDRWRGDPDIMNTRALDPMDDQAIWQLTGQGRAQLVDYARGRLERQWRHELDSTACAVVTQPPLDPNLLTLGLARRFAEYKRPTLLLRDPERLARLLTHPHHPIQLVIAGKAHPADDWGKQALQAWYRFSQRPDIQQHVVVLEDYDIDLAQHLIQGVDVWLNTPRRPWEACGTSGMKILVNGGLNCSSLDGWWAEAHDPELGWAIGNGADPNDSEAVDEEDAEQLYRLLEEEIAPCFYRRDTSDLPREWLQRIRHSMGELTGRFSCNRMLREYLDQYYLPAADSLVHRQQPDHARALAEWQIRLHRHWHELHLGELQWSNSRQDGIQVAIHAYLGGLEPDLVRVQLVAEADGGEPALLEDMTLECSLPGSTNAYRYRLNLHSKRPREHFTARLIPSHPEACIPAEEWSILWQAR